MIAVIAVIVAVLGHELDDLHGALAQLILQRTSVSKKVWRGFSV
jgi:hypothetical protein